MTLRKLFLLWFGELLTCLNFAFSSGSFKKPLNCNDFNSLVLHSNMKKQERYVIVIFVVSGDECGNILSQEDEMFVF